MTDGHESQDADFGPGGYLPERASRRARKVILRARMGLQWVIATIVAGVVIVGAGVLWLVQSDDPPGSPWVAVGAVEAIDEAAVLPDRDVLILTVGRPRAFVEPGDSDLLWCSEERRIESPAGDDWMVWSSTGRPLSGQEPLLQHPTRVHDGVLYLDPSVTIASPGPPNNPEVLMIACAERPPELTP